MYRAVTLAAIRVGADLNSEAELSRLVESLSVTLLPDRVLLGEEDVTLSIRGVEVTLASKFIADSPSVRRRLTIWQRAFAAVNDVVTEGRDQGTLVFPDAFRKYYLTASDEERAPRRFGEYRARGEAASFESVLRDQRERDARDAARSDRPDEARRRRHRDRYDRFVRRGGRRPHGPRYRRATWLSRDR